MNFPETLYLIISDMQVENNFNIWQNLNKPLQIHIVIFVIPNIILKNALKPLLQQIL
jgi:hypothetical protein